MKHLYTFFVPGGLILLIALAVFRPGAFPKGLAPFMEAYPYAVIAGGFAVGWYFYRSRVVYAMLLLAMAGAFLEQFALGHAAARGTGRIVFEAVTLLLPLNLVGFALGSERGIVTWRGLVRLLPLAAQILAVWYLCQPEARAWAGYLSYRYLDPQLVRWTYIPQPALLAFGAAFALQTVRFLRYRNALEGGLLWGLVAAFIGLSWTRPGWLTTSYLATAGLMQVVAVLETSYRMAYHDELTGLPGRRALNEELLQLGSRYAVAMVDVDRFKKFNDRHGHQVGDQVLKMVGAKLAQVGGGAKAFRYGGEEFAILFPGKSWEEAKPYLEKVRETVESSPFALRGRGRPSKKPASPRATGKTKGQVFVTISIGVADRNERDKTPTQVIKSADRALYRAKESGRNQVKP